MTFIVDIKGFDEALFKKAFECEKQLLPQKLFQSNKNHSVLGRVLLGYALENVFDIRAFSLKYTHSMKPYISGQNVFFNISHSGNFVMCSVSAGAVGCDVQEIVEYKPKIAKRFFTEKEQKLLEESQQKKELFTKLWALKESILKKDGTGVSGGLSTYCFADSVNKDSFTKYGNYFTVSKLEGAYAAICSVKIENVPVEVSREQIIKYMDKTLKGD